MIIIRNNNNKTNNIINNWANHNSNNNNKNHNTNTANTGTIKRTCFKIKALQIKHIIAPKLMRILKFVYRIPERTASNCLHSPISIAIFWVSVCFLSVFMIMFPIPYQLCIIQHQQHHRRHNMQSLHISTSHSLSISNQPQLEQHKNANQFQQYCKKWFMRAYMYVKIYWNRRLHRNLHSVRNKI